MMTWRVLYEMVAVLKSIREETGVEIVTYLTETQWEKLRKTCSRYHAIPNQVAHLKNKLSLGVMRIHGIEIRCSK